MRLLDIDGDGRLELLATDMRFGLVMLGPALDRVATLDVIAQLSNPSHISMVDFDRDGLKDFFVADLGDFLPSDHTKGSVVLLRGTRDGKYQQLELDRWPRVADVETADFNGDGTRTSPSPRSDGGRSATCPCSRITRPTTRDRRS